MSQNFNIDRIIQECEPYSPYIGFVITMVISWLFLSIFPIWQFYFLPGIFGGFITGKRYIKGFFVGFLGMLVSITIFLNVTLFIAVEAVELILQSAFGISGMGLIGHIVIIVIWCLYSACGGLIGISIYHYIPFYQLKSLSSH